MKAGGSGFVDIGTIFDEIFDAAQNFREEFQQQFQNREGGRGGFDTVADHLRDRW